METAGELGSDSSPHVFEELEEQCHIHRERIQQAPPVITGYQFSKQVYEEPSDDESVLLSPPDKKKSKSSPESGGSGSGSRGRGGKTKGLSARVIKTVALTSVRTDDLSFDQNMVLKIALDGHSFFYSGKAGTGKSFLLRRIIDTLKKYWGATKVGVTSSTGISAVDIGGTTIHSWAGMGIGQDEPKKIVANLSRYAKAHWKAVQVLIIDEVSMLSGKFFDKLDMVARAMKKNEKVPFGGIQVIACGDFYQLEPIDVKTEGHCFQSAVWEELFKIKVMLTTPFRHAGDPRYSQLLDDIRKGTMSPEQKSLLSTRIRTTRELEDVPGATRLMPFVEAVNRINKQRLEVIPDGAKVFKGTGYYSKGHAKVLEALQRNCRPPDPLVLKVGAVVMLVVNKCMEEGLCNGICGTVVSFSKAGFPCVQFPSLGNRIEEMQPFSWKIFDETNNKKVIASYSQVPLDLAWAITIHKSQGATLDKVAINLDVFAKGQAYVGLSRTRSIEGLFINRLPPDNMLFPDPAVVEFYKTVEELKPIE